MLKHSLHLLMAMAIVASPVLPSSAAFAQGEPKSNQFWWPEKLNLNQLRQHDVESNPYGEEFDYAAEFESLDLDALKKDIEALMTTSQPGSRPITATSPGISTSWLVPLR